MVMTIAFDSIGTGCSCTRSDDLKIDTPIKEWAMPVTIPARAGGDTAKRKHRLWVYSCSSEGTAVVDA